MLHDKDRYEELEMDKERKYESFCKRCGKCCGADDGDACLNLVQLRDATYSCKVYNNRLGKQKTISGAEFNCITIRQAIRENKYVPADCVYRKIFSRCMF